MGQNIIVIGGGGAGLGAAGGAKAVDPLASVTVFTENEDVAYSPCGIPFVHGKEIPSFEALFLADKQSYVDAGIEVRYQTKITAIDTSTKTVQIESDQPMRYDSLVISTGFSYANPGVPGGELDGLYYVKNIREELVYVLSGQVRFTVGNDVYALKMGDSLHFSGDVPHRWENLGKKTAQLIWFALRSG